MSTQHAPLVLHLSVRAPHVRTAVALLCLWAALLLLAVVTAMTVVSPDGGGLRSPSELPQPRPLSST